MAHFLRQRWRQLPAYPVALNRRNMLFTPSLILEVLVPGMGLVKGLHTGNTYDSTDGLPTLGFGPAGLGAVFSSSSARSVRLVADPDGWLSTTLCTMLIVRSLTSTTFGGNGSHGWSHVTGSVDRVQMHLPYSDGTIYWDFGNGNANSGRVSAAGESWVAGKIDAFALVAGPVRGREIWRNGKKLANDGTATAARNITDYAFHFGARAGVTGAGTQNEVIYQFCLLNEELPEANIRAWSENPWQILAPLPSVKYHILGSAVTFNPAWARGANTLIQGGALNA